MKIRLSHVCNSSSSDFVAYPQANACLCYGKGNEKFPDVVKVPFTMELEKLREGDIVTLDRPTEGWTKDYKLLKIYMDLEADGQPVMFFFQELDSNGVPLCQE